MLIQWTHEAKGRYLMGVAYVKMGQENLPGKEGSKTVSKVFQRERMT